METFRDAMGQDGSENGTGNAQGTGHQRTHQGHKAPNTPQTPQDSQGIFSSSAQMWALRHHLLALDAPQP